ncbi:phage major capsid protein [Nocardiopsis trehalosi]|uniref:phage major capsid protein n=1 Tax=Nocardiopsis trehalosi TaxID=109329 RepID=UPI00082A74B9|nr:phage major capsid protein [Nocardiopsis trehalosi]
MNRLQEIDQRLDAIRAELLELAETDLDETQAARFDELETEHAALEEERVPLAKRAATVERMRASLTAGGERATEAGGIDVHVRTDRTPYDDLDQVRSGTVALADVRARALDAIEQAPAYVADEHRERATRLVERSDRHGRIARHMLLTGSPDYEDAFEQVLSGVQPWQLQGRAAEAMRLAAEHQRAINIGTDSAGGFLVPFHLDPTIIMTSAGTTNPFRQIARQVSITTDTWRGITSAGVTTEWLAESQEVGEHNPTLGRPEIPVHKAGSYLEATFEVVQDTTIASQVGMLLAEAKDDEEARVFAVGSGTGRPRGVVTAVAATPASVVSTAAAGAYAVGDVYALRGALPPRHRANASWVASDMTYLLTRQFATGSGPQHAFWADLGMGTPSLLLGRPTYESSEMADAVAAGANLLLVGDFQKYLIVDRIGMTVQFEPLVKGPNQRPTGEVGWFAHWRVGGDVLDANAFRLLQVDAP